jgi:hypothetical protein
MTERCEFALSEDCSTSGDENTRSETHPGSGTISVGNNQPDQISETMTLGLEPEGIAPIG